MNTRDISKLVIAKMLPTPNTKGVDLDDPYYDQLCHDAAIEYDVEESDIDMEIRILLGEVAQFGFGVLG